VDTILEYVVKRVETTELRLRGSVTTVTPDGTNCTVDVVDVDLIAVSVVEKIQCLL
jgi:hypothetical protein